MKEIWERLRALPLAEQVIAALLGGAALLLVEIRFEHREVLGDTWRAWIPLAYLAALLVVGAASLVRFERGGRLVLAALFGLALVVGSLGLWFHADGHPLQALGHVAAAWFSAPGSDAGLEVGVTPPVLAPAAFAGVGLLGLLCCIRR